MPITSHPRDATAANRFPQRPDSSIISEAIPLFFIGRNKDGFWVAREADGRIGGIFLRKQSALRFAKRSTQPGGCATMFLSEHFELDVENKGNPLVTRLGAARRHAYSIILMFAIFGGLLAATIALRFAIWFPLTFLLNAT
jgi:hypothetical protein